MSSSGPAQKATSCAECRRLKLKCDRVFPCSSCIRRGVANLCPNGTLEKGKRGFLKRLEQSLPSTAKSADAPAGEPSTEVAMFVARDTAMSKRIQELEAALISAGVEVPGASQTHKFRSNSHHNSSSNKGVKRARSSSEEGDPADLADTISASESNDVAVGFGTLTIDPMNRSRYIGLSSGSAYLDGDVWGSHDEEECTNTEYEIAMGREIQDQIMAKVSTLPPYEEAVRLASNYFDILSHMYEVIPKERFFTNHLPVIYNNTLTLGTHVLPHTLALVSMVLALGQYFDLTLPRPTVRPRAAELFRIAAFALNCHNVIDGGLKVDTLQGVQALHLMALYQLSLKGEAGAEATYQILGLAIRAMQSQGFHRDGSRWDLPPRELEERRRVFWECYIYDRLQSFTLGRPHAQSDSHFDCKVPTTSDKPLPSDTDPSNSSWSSTRWHIYKFKWATLLGHIMDTAFSVKHPTYSQIMELDRTIDDFYFSLPQWILCPSVTRPVDPSLWKRLFPPETVYDPYKLGGFKGLGTKDTLSQDSQVHSFANMVFVAILHLNRGPFCRALTLEPQELIRSKYEKSIARVVSSSTAIVNVGRGMFVLHPNLTSRLWYWIFHAFTAAVCQAVFVIVAPFHPLAPHALRSLQAAVELFQQVDGKGARMAYARVGQLTTKATRSMSAFRSASMRLKHRDMENSNKRREGKTEEELNKANYSDSRHDERVLEGMDVKEDTPATAIGRFPESNVRNPEDFLGTSTKLVRLSNGFPQALAPDASALQASAIFQSQPSEANQDPFAAMMGMYNPPSESMPFEDQAYAPPYLQSSLSTADTSALESTWLPGTVPRGTEAHSQDYTGVPSTAPLNDTDIDALLHMYDWKSPIDGTKSNAFASVESFAENTGVTGTAPLQFLDPGTHFDDVNGFDLSSFITDGAKAWRYDHFS